MKIPIKYKVLSKVHKIPTYAKDGDSGMDVYINENVQLKPQETKAIGTGLSFEIPEGYEIQIRPRSGLSLNTPLRISNSPGTIDSGYRGELKIIVTNTSISGDIIYTLSNKNNEKGIYELYAYQKIAQMVIVKIEKCELNQIEELSNTNRADKGFGSTGVN